MPPELLCSDCGSPITSPTNIKTVTRGDYETHVHADCNREAGN